MTIARRLVGMSIFVLASARLTAAHAVAVDTAGPLTVTVEAEATIAAPASTSPVRVVIENRGQQAVSGTLQVAVVDDWRIEPAAAGEFAVPARASVTKEFQLSGGAASYSEHYPIHAVARFEWEGKPVEAHPVFVFQAQSSRADNVPPALNWKPFRVAAGGELSLCRLPVRRAVFEVFGQAAQTMPVGWEGGQKAHRATLRCEESTLGNRRLESLVVHPPWFEGRVGTATVEFPLRLPDARPIRLTFATAMLPAKEGKGDGVTFRVRVCPLHAADGQLGDVIFERHSNETTWQPAEVDLSEFAGRTIRLQLESHPGPKRDTTFDTSLWGDVTLIAGEPPAPTAFPPKDASGSIELGRLPGAAAAGYEVRLWPGKRGLLDAVVGLGPPGQLVYFRGFEIRVFGQRVDDARSPCTLTATVEESGPTNPGTYVPGSPVQVRHKFDSPYGSFDLVGKLWIERGMARAAWRLENGPPPQPWRCGRIEDAAFGPWSRKVEQLYAGVGNVVRQPGPRRLIYDGHKLATSYVGFDFAPGFSILQAVETAPDRLEVDPDRNHYSIHAAHEPTFTLIAKPNAFAAVAHWRRCDGLKPAGGVSKLAGRFVFDLWSGRYGESHELPNRSHPYGRESADLLARSFAYGLTDSCVVWHNWQRWGYDVRLPDIMPPNPRLGTPEEFRRLADACRRHGVLFAPHDNYIDFYPDADGFSYEKQIAFNADGQPAKAWLNVSRKSQSYRYRADRIEPFVRRNIEWIKRDFAPTAYFIDVWSSINPYDHWSADGRFFDRVQTTDAWRRQFAWIRQTLGDDAPQISESGHDLLIGWLDGAQTNHLRIGTARPGARPGMTLEWKCEDAERIPWFDAAHHDRFILHGAGYPTRYSGGLSNKLVEPDEVDALMTGRGLLNPLLHGNDSDDYLATEVLTGHPVMVSKAFGRDVVARYWLTHGLMQALALRSIDEHEFVEGDLHRQRVRWSGGAEVWVNRSARDWTVDGHVLPSYGFLANAPTPAGDLVAAVERRGNVICESLVAPAMIYVNGRQIVDDQPAAPAKAYEQWLVRQNPSNKPIDFGAVVTAGGVRLTPEDRALLVTPLPNDSGPSASVTIRTNQLPWKLPKFSHCEALDPAGKVLRRAEVEAGNETIELTCEPGVFAYRLTE